MRLLLDNNLDVRLVELLPHHAVKTVRDLRWRDFSNGALLTAAEVDFDALKTGDKSLPYQTNVKAHEIGVYVLDTPNLLIETIETVLPILNDALKHHQTGTSVIVSVDGWRRLP